MSFLPLTRRFSTDEKVGLRLISVPALAVFALIVAPLVMTLVYSLWEQTYTALNKSVSLTNYTTVLTDPIYRALFLKSLGVSGLATFVSLLFAFPMAYFISFYGGRHKVAWIIAIILPFWTSYLLRVFAWKIVLGYNGVLNSALIWAGLIDQPLDVLIYSQTSVVITLTHAWMPFAILPIYLSLERIDRSLYEAARDLGDPAWARFMRITLPLATPGIIAAALVIFIPTFGDYVTPTIVGGASGQMIANIIQMNFGAANNWPLGAAVSVATILLVALIATTFSMILHFVTSRIR
ncbi:ABC transporter permease [Palleronia sp. LCG004]|uniref:ABC transporter permease n=1 Tax=Palleronia sp. LCG004 TaxID=3079304 RepID=UPI0029438A3B|nr:ABC transporter permease [Palleronia sp. LCG004]WOI56582.1 ABC transporter permease [Palleronia sp. LCG004]